MSQNNAFNDMFKNAFDFNELATQQRRNLEAFAAATQSFTESAQELTKRQTEAAQGNVEQAMTASKEIFSGKSPEVSMAKQTDFTREMFESNVTNLREVVELVTKSGLEAFDVINQRTAETFEEASKATTKKTASKK